MSCIFFSLSYFARVISVLPLFSSLLISRLFDCYPVSSSFVLLECYLRIFLSVSESLGLYHFLILACFIFQLPMDMDLGSLSPPLLSSSVLFFLFSWLNSVYRRARGAFLQLLAYFGLGAAGDLSPPSRVPSFQISTVYVVCVCFRFPSSAFPDLLSQHLLFFLFVLVVTADALFLLIMLSHSLFTVLCFFLLVCAACYVILFHWFAFHLHSSPHLRAKELLLLGLGFFPVIN